MYSIILNPPSIALLGCLLHGFHRADGPPIVCPTARWQALAYLKADAGRPPGWRCAAEALALSWPYYSATRGLPRALQDNARDNRRGGEPFPRVSAPADCTTIRVRLGGRSPRHHELTSKMRVEGRSFD